MKRAGGLFDAVCSWDNLVLAARRARAGKRYRPDVLAFDFRQEDELLALRAELRSGEYRPRPPRHFRIREPKARWITAAAYRDRVVHHAVCNLIEPILDRSMIHDCWANRRGKGSHRAVLRLQGFCRRFPFAVKLDLVKYFASIDHELMLERLGRRFKDRGLLALLAVIVRSGENPEAVAWHGPGDDLLSPLGRRSGLPIGNLTSQLFSNEFLCAFDHRVVERLRPGAYLRFVDDMVVLGEDPGRLREEVAAMREQLRGLRLRLHEERLHLRRVEAADTETAAQTADRDRGHGTAAGADSNLGWSVGSEQTASGQGQAEAAIGDRPSKKVHLAESGVGDRRHQCITVSSLVSIEGRRLLARRRHSMSDEQSNTTDTGRGPENAGNGRVGRLPSRPDQPSGHPGAAAGRGLRLACDLVAVCPGTRLASAAIPAASCEAYERHTCREA